MMRVIDRRSFKGADVGNPGPHNSTKGSTKPWIARIQHNVNVKVAALFYSGAFGFPFSDPPFTGREAGTPSPASFNSDHVNWRYWDAVWRMGVLHG